MNHPDYIAVIIIVALVIGGVLLLAGCMNQHIVIDSEICPENELVLIGEINCRTSPGASGAADVNKPAHPINKLEKKDD